jgi:hypothetical protein
MTANDLLLGALRQEVGTLAVEAAANSEGQAVSSTECLHCGQTREGVKRGNAICGIEGGYEYREIEEEWPRHRWADWNDQDLTGFRIIPEAFERYRRTPIMAMQYAACIDTMSGHVYAEEDNEWGDRAGRCISCGHVAPEARTEES